MALDALRGDLSTRRFWRVHLEPSAVQFAPATAILIDLGPHDLPPYARILKLLPEPIDESPWLNLHRFLHSIDAPVPDLYAAAPEHRALLVEDFGEAELFAVAKQDPAHAADIYRLAIENLLVFHVEGSRRIDQRCIASHVAYDARLFRWELKEFVELSLPVVTSGADPGALEPELSGLADCLGRFPRVLSHRDYHGWNLFMQEGPRLRIIDFQDALMGPAAQDVAVLLTTRNTTDVITPAIETRLLDFYCAGLARRQATQMSAPEFLESYRLCVLQHALKMTGRFMMFERDGRADYARYVPYCLAQARRMLTELHREFPRLSAALGI